MSLQLAAQHLASRGRGPDTTLVHMAPQEVAGLQALAKAHGGTLTTNPDTGLPEAGFLSSILPMVAGAGLSLIPGVGPMMAAGIVGGGTALATGSLQKGLMAGLGAYGGAGLAGGLTAAGAAEAGAAGLGAGASEMAATQAALEQNALANIGIDSTAAAGTGSMSFAPNMSTNVLGTTPIGGPMSVPVSTGQLAAGVPQVATATPMPAAAPSFSSNLSQAGRGFDALLKDPSQFLTKENLRYGLAGLAPVAMDMMTPKQRAEEEKRKAYEYTYSPGRVDDPQQGYTGAFTGERTYFNPVYTRTAAGGGLMDIGPVEAMSRSNQPQMTPAYARGGSSDMAVNPYTGAETFAEGGDTKAVRPVEQDPYYTMSGQSGDAFKYLMGQMPATPRTPAPAPAAVTPVQSTVQARPEKAFGMAGLIKGLMAKDMSGWGGWNNMLSGQPASPEAQGAGGEWVDDTSGLLKPYDFDVNTGTWTPKALPKVWRPYTPEPAPVYTGDTGMGMAQGGIASLAQGGQSHLGDYSDGGRFLRNAEGGTTSDGVSDSIPASIGGKRPARLAENEFVIPARIVSELGNGSSEAGARRLYAMMDRIQKARAKTVGKGKVAVDTKAEKLLPA